MSSHKVLTPEEIAAQAGSQIPYLRLPSRVSVFADRAARLDALAAGHPMEGYLALMAEVARAQHEALAAMPPVRLPAPELVDQCNEHGMPPLNHATHARDPMWCDVTRRLLRGLSERTDGVARDVVMRLEQSRDELYEAQASKLLAGIAFGLDPATAPLIAAGLQVYFSHLVIALGENAFPRLDVGTVCPCCGTRPTASVARIGSVEAGYRFLHCALCSAQWHMVRIKCTNCESTKGIAYQAVDDGTPADRQAVRAECCDECGTYLKIVSMERDPGAEPTADDLATLALDLLVVDSGKESSGVNFMLIHGDPGADEA